MKSKTFRIEELVPPSIFNDRGELAWELIDEKLIITIDQIKKDFPNGTMTINDWVWGGQYHHSGIRDITSPDYKKYSMHSWGKAADIKFSKYSVEEVRQYVVNNPDKYPYVKGIEDFPGMSWLHVDVRNRDSLIKFGK